jgi:hypothetical protein
LRTFETLFLRTADAIAANQGERDEAVFEEALRGHCQQVKQFRADRAWPMAIASSLRTSQ